MSDTNAPQKWIFSLALDNRMVPRVKRLKDIDHVDVLETSTIDFITFFNSDFIFHIRIEGEAWDKPSTNITFTGNPIFYEDAFRSFLSRANSSFWDHKFYTQDRLVPKDLYAALKALWRHDWIMAGEIPVEVSKPEKEEIDTEEGEEIDTEEEEFMDSSEFQNTPLANWDMEAMKAKLWSLIQE